MAYKRQINNGKIHRFTLVLWVNRVLSAGVLRMNETIKQTDSAIKIETLDNIDRSIVHIAMYHVECA